MEISLLKALLSNISSFLHLSSIENLRSELVQKYYHKAEEILKLLKPILDALVDSDIASNEVLSKTCDELGQSVDELREIFETWQPLSSKVYFVLQNESLISKIRTFSLDIFKLLKFSDQCLPDELSSSSLEYCAQKIKQMGYEQTSSIVREAIRDQVECVGPSSEILVKIAESLGLRSNQEILIEAVALEKLKENAEQDEKTSEAELFDQMISLVTRMHDRLVRIKQSQTSSPVPIPADFCCPLSLELMTDPVIVSSGQTYEKAFIKNWIDLGLTVCPKTRQTLVHTNQIPNYTVKALIANWCESNNVKLPDPVKSVGFNQPSSLAYPESGTPRDPYGFPHSSRNQPMSPESTRSTGSPGRNWISSSGMYHEGTSPLHLHLRVLYQNSAVQTDMNNSEQGVDDHTASSLIEQLGRALHELQNQKDASEDRVQWIEIEEHFHNLDRTMKRKYEELQAREKEYMEKEAETFALLAERESAVVAKEQEFLDRVQELKDAAVAIISEAQANHQPIVLESIDTGDNKDNKVSSSLGETNSTEEESPRKLDENADSVVVEIKPRPELTQFCEQMDSRGLLSFIMENQKNLYSICEELSISLESANDPARMVLDSLEAFYPPVETTPSKDKKDAVLQGMRKSCIVFMEALAAYLARLDSGADHLLNPVIKQQAKAIADEWKPKLAIAGSDATNGNSLEAEAFLHLLSTFRIASEFDDEELCKLVVVVARRRQAPELCRSLGLTHKIAGVVESLISSGKQIEAVRFIHAFQLSDRFPPVPLLKTYLKEYRRNFQGKGANAGGRGGQVDVNAQELTALKAVIRCVEEYKLEADYPQDPLQKRLAQLVKCQSDKKKSGDFGKHQQSKKHRMNGGYRGFRGGAAHGAGGGWQGPPVFAERTPYAGMPERYNHAVPNPCDYQLPSQSAYGQPATTDQRLYYEATPSNYGNYMGPGMRSSHQPYM